MCSQYSGVDDLDLASNLNPCGSGAFLDDIVTDRSMMSRYPDEKSCELREKIAAINSINVENIFIGNGSSEIIFMLLDIFSKNRDVIVSANGFFGYRNMAYSHKIKPLVLGGQLGDQPGYVYFIDDLLNHASYQDSLIFLDSPSNPFGFLYGTDDIRQILTGITQNSILIMDEAYIEYVDAYHSTTSINLLNDFDNLFVLRTFSKAYGLAGARVGYAISNSRNIDRLKEYSVKFNVNLVGQELARKSLDNLSHLELSRSTVARFRSEVAKVATMSGLKFWSGEGPFVAISGPEINILIRNFAFKGIKVRDLSEYYGGNMVRISSCNVDRISDVVNIIRLSALT